MSITILQRSPMGMRSIKLQNRYLYTAVGLFVIFILSSGVSGYYYAVSTIDNVNVKQITIENWKKEISNQWQELELAKKTSQQQLNALTAKLAMVQAHVRRLDAAGDRIVTISGLDSKEFNFDEPPAIGGPEEKLSNNINYSNITNSSQLLASLDKVDQQLVDKEQQLSVLESLLMDKHMGLERYISGRPIVKGWMSSFYGERNDPFTGKPAWHGGIDFAGAENSGVLATAAGIVTWVGDRSGYGLLIEINHGDGIVTRYGHNKTALVKQGDVVSKGQIISKMGNSGRSTGAHVHYEIIKNGQTLNPLSYVNRRPKS